MTVKNIIDALCGIHFDMILDAAPAEMNGTSPAVRQKKQKKWIKWFPIAACILLCACLTPFLLKLLGGQPVAASEVKLTGISGGDLAELPSGVDEIKLPSDNEFMLLSRRPTAPALTDEDFQQPEDVDVFGQATLSPIAQTVVLFDENKYASVTIALDNPNEYYICDFYMTCSQPDAMINVDNKWLPLDGSVKIRWTGSTNREATYTVYLPTVSGDTTVSITDMRYLNETEIAVDLAEHNVANVYRMEIPVKTEFVVNTTEGFYFRVITNENCLSYTVENAVPTDEADVYRLESDGTYTVKYTFSIPGSDRTGEGAIISEEIEVLRIFHKTGIYLADDQGIPLIAYTFGDGALNEHYGVTGQITNPEIVGTGITFHPADPKDPKEKDFPTWYFCDANLTISINGSEFAHALYIQQPHWETGQMITYFYTTFSTHPVNLSPGSSSGRIPVEIKLNGYTIYKGDGSDIPIVD